MFPIREKSKKLAEQAAAIVCLRVLGLHEGRVGEGDSGLFYKRKREASLFTDDGKEDKSKKRHVTAIVEATTDINSDLINSRSHVDDSW